MLSVAITVLKRSRQECCSVDVSGSADGDTGVSISPEKLFLVCDTRKIHSLTNNSAELLKVPSKLTDDDW